MKKGMIAGIAAVVIVSAVVFAAAALRRSNETAADSDDDFAHDSSTNVESADDAEESTTITEDEITTNIENDNNDTTTDIQYIDISGEYVPIEERMNSGETVEWNITFSEPWKCHDDLYNQKMYDGASLKELQDNLSAMAEELNSAYQNFRDSGFGEIEKRSFTALRELYNAAENYYRKALTDFTIKVTELETKYLIDLGFDAEDCHGEMAVRVNKLEYEKIIALDRGYILYTLGYTD